MLFKTIFIGVIRFYQLALSPFVGNCCRFYPTCSDYGLQAIGQHGCLKGGWLLLRRLVRCQPWCEGGCDFVPPDDNS